MQLRYGPSTQKPDTIAQAKMQLRCGQQNAGAMEVCHQSGKGARHPKAGGSCGSLTPPARGGRNKCLSPLDLVPVPERNEWSVCPHKGTNGVSVPRSVCRHTGGLGVCPRKASHDLRVSRRGAEGRYRTGNDGWKRRDAVRAWGMVSGYPLAAPQGQGHDAEG